MEFSKATRITFIIVCGVIILGLAGFSVLSGGKVDLSDILETILAGIAGLLAGAGIAGKR